MLTHGREVEVSNADRVVYPEVGVTKGDVVGHYDCVAELMLPHVRARPLTLLRAPKGMAGERFMQKNAASHYPDWVRRVRTPKKGGELHMPVADEPAVLPYLAQQGTLEVHQWLSASDALFHPLDLVVDLDPSGDPGGDPQVLADVRAVTRVVRDVLVELDVDPDLKTSGSRGYHVVVRLDGSATADEASAVARAVAEEVVRRAPDVATVAFSKDERGGRVYVDWLRNGWAQTVVAPYSLRARENAPVSVPIGWDELSRVAPQDHTITSLPRRLAQKACPWQGRADRPGHALDAARAALDLT